MKISKDTVISICVFLSGFSCFAQLYYFQPLLPNLAQQFYLSATQSSLAVSLSTGGMMVGLFAMMFIADRIPRKTLIGSALLISSVFSISTSFAPGFVFLMLLCFAKGVLLSGATSVSMAYIAEEVSPQKRSRITGFYIAGNAIGGMCGRVIASYLGAEYSWRISSLCIGLACAIFATLFLIFSPKSLHFTPLKEKFAHQLYCNWKLLTHKKLVPFYLTGGLILGVFVSLYNYLGFFITQSPFNFPPHLVYYIYLIYIFGVFGSIATAHLAKKTKPSALLQKMLLFSLCGVALIFIPFFGAVTLGLAIFTFGFFVSHVLCNQIVGEYDPQKRSVTISIYLLSYYLGSSTLGSLTGFVLDYASWHIFLFTLMVLLLLGFFVVRRGVRLNLREP